MSPNLNARTYGAKIPDFCMFFPGLPSIYVCVCGHSQSYKQTPDYRLPYLKNHQYGRRKQLNKEHLNIGFDAIKLNHLF